MEEEKIQKVEKKVEKKVEEEKEEEDDCFEEFLFNDTQEEIQLPMSNNQVKYWEEQWSDDEKNDLLQNLKREMTKSKA